MKKYIKVYNDIKQKIENNIFSEGDKLPTIEDLALIYDVSIITVKKALSLLKSEHLITTTSGVGTFVNNPNRITINQKKILSLIVPDFSEAFCLEIVNTFERLCRQSNFTPIISRTFGSPQLEDRIILEHIELGSQGICIMPIHDEYFNQKLLRLSLNHFPVVTIDRILPSVQLSSVTTDNRSSSELLATYALQKDLRFPLVISPTFKNSHILSQRVLNFIKCFEKHKILNYDNYIPDPSREFNVKNQETMKNSLLKIIDQGIDVIFCVEYNIALDVKRFINKNNIAIEIVCFDHPIASEKLKFTHIQQDQHEIAIQAFNLLQRQMKLSTNIEHVEVPGALITL